MGLAVLVLGLVVFLGVHTLVTLRQSRARLQAALGRGPYMLLFSVASVIGLVLIVYGFGLYRRNEWVDVWHPPVGMRHVAIALMLPAFILLVATYVPGHIKRVMKHPMLVAVKIWALGHLLSNGDLGSMILFGSFLAWAVYDRIAVKRRERVEGGQPPPAFHWRNDVVAVAVGTIVYLAVGYTFHPLLIGVPAFAR